MNIDKLLPRLFGQDDESDRDDLDELGRAPREEWYDVRNHSRWLRQKRRHDRASQVKMQRRYSTAQRKAQWRASVRESQLALLDNHAPHLQAMRANVIRSLGSE